MTRRLIENFHRFWPIVKPGGRVTLAGFAPVSLDFEMRAPLHMTFLPMALIPE